MLDLTLLKEYLDECLKDLDIHINELEEYIHGESLLKVNTFHREKGEEIQYNYNVKLKQQFIFVRDSLKVLFSLCMKIKFPGTQSVDIFDLADEINKSLFINSVQKMYLIFIIEQGDHEIKKHIQLGKEFIILTQKIENKIDTIKLLNCFIDEKYVLKEENTQIDSLGDSHDLINGLFDEYQFWEKPLEGISELGDLNYSHTPSSKNPLVSDDKIWSELIKTTYTEKKCDPFLNLYTQIQTKIEHDDPKAPDLKKRRISQV